MTSSKRAILGLIVFTGVTYLLAALAGLSTQPGPWYDALAKPSWTPPGWIIGPVWWVLYTLMAISAWLVWREPACPARSKALTAWLVQLLFNVLWSPVFFLLHRLDLALAVLGLLWITVTLTILLFYRRRLLAAVLLLPYLAWISFAGVLNYTIWTMNR
jgi:translocator protein